MKKIWCWSFDCDINSITIPKGVEQVATGTFEYCLELNSIKVEDGNNNYFSIDGVLYDNRYSPRTLSAWPANKDFNGIPKEIGVSMLGMRCFENCKFTEIVIPECIYNIQSQIFYRCKNLRSVTFPSHKLNDCATDLFLETGGSVKEIHMKATTAPERCYFNSNDAELKNATIYIPKGSSYQYEFKYSNSEWKKFPIKEED